MYIFKQTDKQADMQKTLNMNRQIGRHAERKKRQLKFWMARSEYASTVLKY